MLDYVATSRCFCALSVLHAIKINSMKPNFLYSLLLMGTTVLLCHCRQNEPGPAAHLIARMNLKRGEPITCGPAVQQLGTVSFKVTGTQKTNRDFDLGIKLLRFFVPLQQ